MAQPALGGTASTFCSPACEAPFVSHRSPSAPGAARAGSSSIQALSCEAKALVALSRAVSGLTPAGRGPARDDDQRSRSHDLGCQSCEAPLDVGVEEPAGHDVYATLGDIDCWMSRGTTTPEGPSSTWPRAALSSVCIGEVGAVPFSDNMNSVASENPACPRRRRLFRSGTAALPTYHCHVTCPSFGECT